jgi:agmatinase
MPDINTRSGMSEKDHAYKSAGKNGAGAPPTSDFTPFAGCKRSRNYSAPDVDVVISGVPFDLATTERRGARLGPASIRRASAHLAWEIHRWPWDFHVYDILGVIDYGDLRFDISDKDRMMSQLQHHAAHLLAADKTMLTLGGDHFITLPLLREHAAKHGPVAIIHFDAHTDTENKPDHHDHGTVFFHAVNEGLVVPERSVQVGIRTEYIRDNHRFTVLDADWVTEQSTPDVLKIIKRIVGQHPAYITFDIDCLDPAFAPGTGTPAVGGLSTHCALKITRGLVGSNVIGMDVVEVCPPYDHAEITALAAATLSLELLYVLAANRNAKSMRA